MTGQDAETGEVIAMISDEGCGMAANDLLLVKTTFHTTKANSGGTGLGIAISNAIVKEHGGILLYESSPGMGTRAIIRIPVSRHSQEGKE